MALRTEGAEQGRVEPSAMLVSTFQIEIGGGRVFRLAVFQGQVAGSRLEPHVENVHFFLEGDSAAMLAFRSCSEGVSFGRIPGIAPGTRKQIDNLAFAGRVVH